MRSLANRVKAVTLPAVLLVAAWAGVQYGTGNVHQVAPGLYRSGQLTAERLDGLIRSAGIRSVLNLRGAHPEESWWRDEAAVAARHGVDYRSLAISARSEPDDATMDEVAALVARMPKPLLVHCRGGSDRSGLASAVYELTVAGESPEEAGEQLSLLYGHFPFAGSPTRAMDTAFARFATRHEAARERVAEDLSPRP